MHESARQRIDVLHAAAEQKVFQAEVAELLVEVFATYPDAGVVQAAADQGRRLIAGRLKVAPQREAERLVNALTKFSPQDRLLLRDGQRVPGRRTGAEASAGGEVNHSRRANGQRGGT